MSTVTHPGPDSTTRFAPAGSAKPRPIAEFLSTYVFSKDHKVIGLQFLFSTLVWFLIGGLLALAVRMEDNDAAGLDITVGQRVQLFTCVFISDLAVVCPQKDCRCVY